MNWKATQNHRHGDANAAAEHMSVGMAAHLLRTILRRTVQRGVNKPYPPEEDLCTRTGIALRTVA